MGQWRRPPVHDFDLPSMPFTVMTKEEAKVIAAYLKYLASSSSLSSDLSVDVGSVSEESAARGRHRRGEARDRSPDQRVRRAAQDRDRECPQRLQLCAADAAGWREETSDGGDLAAGNANLAALPRRRFRAV